MAQNITLMGATYSDVPEVDLPKSGGGTAKFIEEGELINVYSGSSNPSSSTGKNGDVYLKVVN